VGLDLLLEHVGDETNETMYQTSYGSTWNFLASHKRLDSNTPRQQALGREKENAKERESDNIRSAISMCVVREGIITSIITNEVGAHTTIPSVV
jgi:hypothetical protein